MAYMFGKDWLSLEYFERYHNSSRAQAWENKLVLIQSDRGFWRCAYMGYTDKGEHCGIYTFKEALAHTLHCGPEKRVRFFDLSRVIKDGKVVLP